MAVPTAMDAQDVRLGGFIQLDRRLHVGGDSVQFADFYNIFRPELTAVFEDRVDVVASLDLRFYDFTAVRSADELTDANRHFPHSLTVWEANARITGFLFEPLDVTIGKQRIQWGTADGLNPTDRFNAYDLSDLTDFTARIPTWAVRAEYYLADEGRLEAVWAPTAHGPLLPPGAMGLLTPAGSSTRSETPRVWEHHFVPPARALGDSQLGVKLAGYKAGVDVSVSYFDGFDGIHVTERLLIVPAEANGASSGPEGHAWTTLPRIRVLGADFVTERGGVGLWGEGAVVWPEEVELLTDRVSDADSSQDRTVALTGQPYATWTLGGDYTFPGGWYLNVQWAHGLFLERGADQLHDYLVGGLERRLFRDAVTFSLDGALEVAEWSQWPRSMGFGLFPELVYAPVDNVDISLGTFVVGGSASSLFGRWGDADQLFVRVRASF